MVWNYANVCTGSSYNPCIIIIKDKILRKLTNSVSVIIFFLPLKFHLNKFYEKVTNDYQNDVSMLKKEEEASVHLLHSGVLETLVLTL